MPDANVKGLFNHGVGIPLPDDCPLESYRPPIEKLPDDFFRKNALTQPSRSRTNSSEQVNSSPPAGPQKIRGVSTGGDRAASFCSSASSTGSTPTGGRARRVSPYSVGSPLSAGGGNRRSHHLQHSSMGHAQPRGLAAGQLSGIAGMGTAASSPHGSSASTAAPTTAGATSPPSIGGPILHHAGAAGGVVPAGQSAGPAPHGRPGGPSRDGSRGSSPWHVPSPMSVLSTSSDRVNSSQPSGSESCGDYGLQYAGTHISFDHDSEDPSQSDTPNWQRSNQQSDSDCTTPRSRDVALGHSRLEEESGATAKDVLWENIKSEMTRVELSRDRLPRRLDSALSPGSTGAVGNFREAVGMNENGPVVPLTQKNMATANASATAVGGAPVYGFNPHPRPPGGSGSGGSHGTGHGGHGSRSRRMKKMHNQLDSNRNVQ
eukprot:gnl/TRDRNA2_/TRDRNA2_116374_c2_seq1.p1 gnl/TRDRNA2_/TRDRNA2_116374_c2~~gnl/TRDRNA2_/TRDRNA2_116374_c2_seq1.p1  ORF type:complete len:431 (+),score=27.23 gnl/TRDRNA2_/TRDRNA2_116374_c2_seq1:115-1407(+)